MKQKSNSLFLAKPSGITLSEHIENVLLQGDAIFNSFPFTFIKYKCFTGKDLYKRLSAAIKYHDDGKKKILGKKRVVRITTLILSGRKPMLEISATLANIAIKQLGKI